MNSRARLGRQMLPFHDRRSPTRPRGHRTVIWGTYSCHNDNWHGLSASTFPRSSTPSSSRSAPACSRWGGLVESQIRRAVEGLQAGNLALLDDVITTDHKVNGMEVALDGECSHVIVKRQPAANDLRLIFAITKTVTDLERIGDEAQKIARMGKNITSTSPAAGCPA